MSQPVTKCVSQKRSCWHSNVIPECGKRLLDWFTGWTASSHPTLSDKQSYEGSILLQCMWRIVLAQFETMAMFFFLCVIVKQRSAQRTQRIRNGSPSLLPRYLSLQRRSLQKNSFQSCYLVVDSVSFHRLRPQFVPNLAEGSGFVKQIQCVS